MEQSFYFLNFKKCYTFQDISVYFRKGNGTYIDLAEFAIGENNREILLPTNGQYVISFINTNAPHRKCISEATLAELRILANLKSERFVKQMKRCEIEAREGDALLAYYCAKTIVNYNYGKGLLIEEETAENKGIYAFTRHDGYNHYPVVLKKEFRRI